MKPSIWQASAVLVLSLFQSTLTASALEFSGSDKFQDNVPATAFTAPGAVWSFSFTVDDHPTPTLPTNISFGVLFSNFQYALNGVAVSVTPEIRFFSSDFGGMLDIGFVNNEDLDTDPITGLAFMGPGIFTGSTFAPTLQGGSYTATGGAVWVESFPVQSLIGGTVVVGPLNGTNVPEPGTIFEVLGASVCFLATAIVRASRRKS